MIDSRTNTNRGGPNANLGAPVPGSPRTGLCSRGGGLAFETWETTNLHLRMFVIRRLIVSAAAFPLLLFPGCKKETTPPVEVTVQAEHPEKGTISEHIAADAILAPLAQAAI